MVQTELFPPDPPEQAEPSEPPVLTVSQLTSALKDLIEARFPDVWVAGEVSNFSRPQSGHCYLTLKDEAAQIRAVIWKSTAQRIRFDLHDGLAVVCRGGLDLYAPRGSYQLVVRQIQPQGIGALELALRQLQTRLAAEGLFDPHRKRPLPVMPRRIAVVTSPSGAALRDFLQVLGRRWMGADVLVVPVRVQGTGAGEEIAAAIRRVNRLATPIDTLVVTRGGGSLEDLWEFNTEAVVRAIAESRIPVVSAVGHEIDVTLSDLAADRRALTPSEAAELVVPSTDDLRAALGQVRRRLAGAMRLHAGSARARLDELAARRVLRRPLDRIHDLARRLDELGLRATRSLRRYGVEGRRHVERLAAQLESLSPLGVLARGYTVTQRADDGRTVSDAMSLAPGDRLLTRFARGQAISRIEELRGGEPPGAS